MTIPWQLAIFNKSLKKKEKVKTIIEFMESTQNKKCLEIGCEKGITSYFLRQQGGLWLNTDIDRENVCTTKTLVKKNVLSFKEDALPFRASAFDCIIAIDTLEHIDDDQSFLQGIYRILSEKGLLYITVPCSKHTLILNKIAKMIGMTLEYYGHKREGYTKEGLKDKLLKANFKVTRVKGFSRFFTEAIEMLINYSYIFLLNKSDKKTGIKGSISPSKEKEFNAHRVSFKIYSIFYPILRLICQLDKLLFFTSGYVIILEAKKKTES